MRNLGQTVDNALHAAEERSACGPQLRRSSSRYWGMIGGGDVGATARTLILAAVDYLATSPATRGTAESR